MSQRAKKILVWTCADLVPWRVAYLGFKGEGAAGGN